MINELVQELRSYPAHYVAAHRAADALEKAEKSRSQMHYYACRLEDDLVKLEAAAESLREHIAEQQLDIVTLGQEVGRLREALEKIAQHDMQAIAMDALQPGERIREKKLTRSEGDIGGEDDFWNFPSMPSKRSSRGEEEMSDLVERLRLTLSDLPGNDDDLFEEIHAQRDEAAKEIVRLQDTLRHIGSVDAEVIVGHHHDASKMTPKDWYEAGLQDGSLAVRDAVKAAARAALGEEEKG